MYFGQLFLQLFYMLRGMAWLNPTKTKEPFTIFKTVSILVIL